MAEWPEYTLQYQPGGDYFVAETSVNGVTLSAVAEGPEINPIEKLHRKVEMFEAYGEPKTLRYEKPDLSYQGSE